ncbi:MAG: ABC transporter ATP-binding protein [Candidatus Saccharimonadales bacterium]
MAKKQNMTPKEQFRAIAGVAALSFRAAPGAVVFKLFGALINALLPIATTFFAAKATTELAAAFAGDITAKDKVLLYVSITAVLGLIMTIWRSIDNYVQTKMRYTIETKVSNQMYEHFLSLDFWRYDDKETIDLYDRALKFSEFFAYIFDRIATIVSDLIAAISAVIALMFVNWVLSLFIFVALIPGVYAQFRLSRAQIRHWNEHVEDRRTLDLLEYTITRPKFISELRLYNMVHHLLDRRLKLRDKSELHRILIERKTVPLTIASDAVSAIAEVVSLIWISLQVVAQKQPVGQFLYVQQMVSRAMSSANSLVSTASSIDEDIANLFDYERFMKLPARETSGINLTTNPETIEFNNVSFHYPGNESREVLQYISLSIRKNQHVAIVGENGAGKSTLIKLLTGLYEPTSGSVALDGIDTRDINIDSWHKQLGVLQQDFITYNFATARDNVRFGDIDIHDTGDLVTKALDEAEATNFIQKLPKGADSYVNNWMETDDGVKGVEISGGQWQRLALARNFYRNSPIVILDEPTSAIDALAEARIFKRLFTDKDRTIIAISHRLSTIKKADIIYMLKDGKVVETGTHDQLIAKNGEFYKMFEAQIKD